MTGAAVLGRRRLLSSRRREPQRPGDPLSCGLRMLAGKPRGPIGIMSLDRVDDCFVLQAVTTQGFVVDTIQNYPRHALKLLNEV